MRVVDLRAALRFVDKELLVLGVAAQVPVQALEHHLLFKAGHAAQHTGVDLGCASPTNAVDQAISTEATQRGR